jgi:unsaturated chondroitin disaccharide hydrolase
MADRILPQPIPLVPPHGYAVPAEFGPAAAQAWEVAAEKVRGLVERHPDQFPLYTEGGKWAVDAEAWTNWCEGFLGGQLWLLARRTGDRWFRQKAEHYSRHIEGRKNDRDVHDLGFLFWPTWRRWYEEAGDPSKNDVVIQAGRTLALRFNEKGRFLRSFLAPDSLFIDIMMNVGIIFHAAQETGDPKLANVAIAHCLTSRRVLIRGDGSASHEGIFDLETSQFLRQTTQQGWRDDSSWARGQGWAMHGFGTAYRYTGDRRFLETASACAEFYIERTAERLVPPNDWEEPHPSVPYESSAAAIAADALWQLACLVQDNTQALTYADYAVRILVRLCQEDFLATKDPAWEGILRHGIYHEGKRLGVDESVMWGDYWFLDALDLVERSTTAGRR